MFLDSGEAIATQIKALIACETAAPLRLAVAFWGKGADLRLPDDRRIICDLESGACNPSVIRTLRDQDPAKTLKLSGLHAKVVVGSCGAIISSANMSTNGLGADGANANGTIEAGYYVSAQLAEYKKIVAWFDYVWSKASEITDDDLDKAQNKWDLRPNYLPPGQPQSVGSNFDTRAFLLVERREPKHNICKVKLNILKAFEEAYPDIRVTELGKIAMWACHLVLNKLDLKLERKAKDGEVGPMLATNDWILNQIGNNKSNKSRRANVEMILRTIEVREDIFPTVIRDAASQILSADW